MRPDISIVIEWDNYLLAESGRSTRMLEQLGKQINELHRKVEIISVFNPDYMDKIALEKKLKWYLHLEEEDLSICLSSKEAPDLNYYEMKNEGSKIARGEILVFLDCDVIPEEGWLSGIVEPFYHNPDINVLAGSTYINYSDLYSKSFALGWMYSPRINYESLHNRTNHFWANNVAFRKEIFMKYLFPSMPDGVYRGSCTMLSRQFKNEGIKVWTNTGARVSHPAPNGYIHFYRKGLAQGRDNWLRDYKSVKLGFGSFFYVIT